MFSETIVIALGFVGGLLAGSFLNVLIYRLPREVNVVTGRSKCPDCKNVIAWYDNIPLVSYLLLKGRCRRCGWQIPRSYPVVELLSGTLAAAMIFIYGVSIQALWIYTFLAVLLVITIIDWHHQIIPDVLSLGGTVLGWVGAVVCLDIGLVDSLIGSVTGAGLLFAIAVIYKAIRKADGMGGGDVKLMAMIGAFLGWQMVFPVLFLASFFGALYGISLMAKGGTGKTAVAFGSFLAPSATLVLILGSKLWDYYIGFYKG